MTAWQNKDAATLKQTMAPDFLFVGPRGVSTRDGWLSSLGFCSLVSYSISDVQMRTLPSKAAMLIYKLNYVGDCGGQPIPADTVVTDTFARRNGRWWIVTTTFTPVMH
ncbi:MAG: nuclear transport factor 2 family protein [Terracidiphilus sp.]